MKDPEGHVRTCRYNHGTLDRVPGEWAMDGYDVPRVGDPPRTAQVIPNGHSLLHRVYRCRVCAYVELAAHRSEEA